MDVIAAETTFTRFVEQYEAKLRLSLVAMYGPERGREAAAEAFAYAWEHWDRVRVMERPVGYLFRVGQSRTRHRLRPWTGDSEPRREPWVEPALPSALQRLSRRQRTAVVLVHAYGWTHGDVAELMGVRTPTVKKHVQRGLAKLRHFLGVSRDA
jgi:RNA polymerase sigma-70 factor (ECF subfamily)